MGRRRQDRLREEVSSGTVGTAKEKDPLTRGTTMPTGRGAAALRLEVLPSVFSGHLAMERLDFAEPG